jgi:4-amino-4-deoxy-L-arabinose transferase-like glycosyltransferase
VSKSSFLFALLIAGAVLRIMAVEFRPPDAPLRAPDEPEYLELAHNLWLEGSYSLQDAPTAYRDVLFPAVSSLLLRIGGGEMKLILYLQILLSCLTGWLIYELSRTRFSENIGLLLAGSWMLYPGAIILCALFLTETVFVFLWALALWIYDRLEARAVIVNMLLLGVTLGLLCLTRAAGLLLLAAITIYVLLIRYETPFRERLRTALIVVGMSLLVMLPWMLRNQFVMNSFSLNTNGGINLLIGNNRYATGAYRFDEPVEAILPPVSSGEALRNAAASEAASDYFWGNMQQSFELWPRKFAFLWSTDVALLAHYYPRFGDVKLAEYLHALPLWMLLVTAIPYMLILLAGTAGFYLVKRFPARGLFILQLAMIVFAAMLSIGMPRYHFPAMPALMIGGGALLHHLPFRDAPPWRRLFLYMALAIFVGIWSYEAATIMGFSR